MKIVVLNGSPRKNGNTAFMVKSFVEAIDQSKHEVSVVECAYKNVAGCLACEYCHTKGNGKCVQQDDMQEIVPLLAEADMLVLASPIYYLTMSAQIQAVLQRTYCMMKPPKLKKMALLLSSHSPKVYDAVLAQYHAIAGFWEVEEKFAITACEGENKSDDLKQKIKDVASQI